MEIEGIQVEIKLDDRSVPHSDRKFVSAWLEHDDLRSHIFYCNNCQYGLFRYRGDVVTLVPGDASEDMKFPMYIMCKGSSRVWGKCPYVYVVEGFTRK